MKVCAVCSAYYLPGGGRQVTCLAPECKREQRRRTVQAGNRRWREQNPARKHEHALSRRRRVQDWLAEVKLEAGCVDCGYNRHPAALDFDHVRGEKEINLSSCQSWAKAQAELEKCEVRCANCHRERTAERRAA